VQCSAESVIEQRNKQFNAMKYIAIQLIAVVVHCYLQGCAYYGVKGRSDHRLPVEDPAEGEGITDNNKS
jgi:hypothetical protein